MQALAQTTRQFRRGYAQDTIYPSKEQTTTFKLYRVMTHCNMAFSEYNPIHMGNWFFNVVVDFRFTKISLIVLSVLLASQWPVEGQLVRKANTTLNLPSELATSNGYTTENALGGLTFDNPICVTSPPGETERMFITQRGGSIIVVQNLSSTPTKQSAPFLNLNAVPGLVAANMSRLTTEGECGLLSMAFHPNFSINGFFYVFYSLEVNSGNVNSPTWRRFQRIARFQVSATDPNRADPTSQMPLITQYDEASNHNGGDMAFGNDGYLYVSLGDEGAGGDSYNNSRFINRDFFGAMLRLDVDRKANNLSPNPHTQTISGTNPFPSAVHAGTYKIPADNPFIGATTWHGLNISPSSVRTEFFATGLRNPWRFSFDPPTGRLFCGDVGQNNREEIDLIEKSVDYGWSWREGSVAYNDAPSPSTPPATGFNPIAPIHDYTRGDGYSVTGGVVARGTRLTELSGKYIFADYGTGNVWALTENGGSWTRSAVLNLPGICEFGTDPRNGDILLARLGSDSAIQRIVRAYSPATSANTPPATLSATGAFSDTPNLIPHSGIVRYDTNVNFWSDYSLKQRWFAIKNTTDTIGFSPTGNWTLPTGTTWVKHFDIETKRGDPSTKRKLETRFIVKTADDIYGLTYRWREDQTDADLVDEDGASVSMTIDVNGTATQQTWRFPSRGECRTCHTAQGGYALSFNTHQLNRDFLFGTQTQNQISALSDAGYFSSPITPTEALPAFANAADTTQSIEWRVRSYLAVNCVSCHQPGGSGLGNWDARITTPTDSANLINGMLNNHGGDVGNRFVVPGDLTRSMLLTRLQSTTATRMPPIGSTEIDPSAVQLITTWINQSLPTRQSFAQWQIANSVPATGDTDHDGADNRMEFLTNTDPNSNADSYKLGLSAVGNQLNFQFLHPANRGALVETSIDLLNWTPWITPGNKLTYPASPISRNLTAPTGSPAQFMRVHFSEP